LIVDMTHSSNFLNISSPRGDYFNGKKYKKKNALYKRPLSIVAAIFVLALIIFLLKRIFLPSGNENIGGNTLVQLSSTNQERIDPEFYMKELSWAPRIFVFKNFLTDEECDRMIKMAKDRLKQSSLYSGEGNFADSKTRSSQDMFFNPEETRWIDERIARATRIPLSHGESLTVIHYGPTQQYLPHYDYFQPNSDAATDRLLDTYGNRVATFIMYLNDLPEGAGGETKFPNSESGPIAVRPKKGDATFFYNMLPDGTLDERSLHMGSPVIHGEKWIATKWMREKKWQHTEDYTPTFGTAAKEVPLNKNYAPTFGTAAAAAKDLPKEAAPKQETK
jgi:hypothetical protein